MKSTYNLFAATLLFCLPLVSSAEWSIGIYAGNSPLDVSSPAGIANPVLTSDDVTDVNASFVADPFMLFKDGTWYMFFEVYSDNGDIAYASSLDGLNWTYHQVVINETFHMSYPHVFEWQGETYMVPETHEANAIRLYKATGFPTQWTFVGNILIGEYRDSSLFRHDNKWWMFTTEGVGRDDTLQLFFSNELLGPWQAHPLSPVITNDPNIARSGGRVTLFDGRLFRYTQDTYPTYGNMVRAFEITELTTTTYAEIPVVENPILDSDGLGWNADGMHHIDPHQLPDTTWLAVVDGNGDPNQLDFYGLWLSNATDRSGSILLDGEALVQGDEICVYLLPEFNVDQVNFSLDGSLQQVESYPPYDFSGTGSDSSCNLYDTIGLTLDEHILSAEIIHLDSSITHIESYIHVFPRLDVDADGLSNADELSIGTDPYMADTDNDGLNDGVEVNTYGTDPLKVDTDGDGVDDYTEIVNGTDPNEAGAPTADFTYSCIDLYCDFTESATDSDGSVIGWTWDFGDGNISTAQNPSHTYATAGTYTVSLTVTDNGGATGSTSLSVTVTVYNVAPTAGFTTNATDLSVDFNDSSTDSDGSVIGWTWDFGDGNISTAQNPSHTYATAGTYTVSLTVTDNGGATGSTSLSVTVTVSDTTAPSITAPENLTVEATGETTPVSLGLPIVTDDIDPNPVVSNNAPADFPVSITTVTWTATDAAGNSATATQTVMVTDTTAPSITAPGDISVESSDPVAVNLGTPTVSDLVDRNPIVTNDALSLYPPGSTTVTWTATDASGNSATATQNVTVSAPVPQPPAAPTNLIATVEKSGKGKNKVVTDITLSWTDNSDNETGFVVEGCQKIMSGKGKTRIVTCDYVEIFDVNGAGVGENQTSFTLDLSNEHDHFRVKAVNDIGSSAWSNEARINL